MPGGDLPGPFPPLSSVLLQSIVGAGGRVRAGGTPPPPPVVFLKNLRSRFTSGPCGQGGYRQELLPRLLALFFLVFFFLHFKASPAAYGNSQARGPIGAVAAGLYHSHSNARSEPLSVTYTTAQGTLDP